MSDERSDQGLEFPRWTMDVTHIWYGKDGWCHLPFAIDSADWEIRRWIREYNTKPPREPLGFLTPAEWRRRQRAA